MKQIILSIIVFLVISETVFSQENGINKPFKNVEFGGYLSSVQSAIAFDNNKDFLMIDNLIHNRLNFHWYGLSGLSASVQFRNRLLYGDQIRMGEFTSAEAVDSDRGYLDMAWNLATGNSFVLNSTIDRAWLGYARNNFDLTLGRQRINWGQSFVWNTNDIFNAYSFFDFDYPERPGSDALRIQYYPGYTSTVEIAAKLDEHEKVTAAMLGRVNIGNYDVQVLLGVLDQEDYTLGFGWTGNIKGMSFTGEGNYLHPVENARETSGIFLLSTGGGYTFDNSLHIQVEGLYSRFDKRTVSGFAGYYSTPLSVKNLAFTELSLFAQASYPITPLFNASMALMYYPEIDGYYAGPSIDYNLGDNLTLTFFIQSFGGKFIIPGTTIRQKQELSIGFLRFKINF